jgi:hypothetical protein
VVFCCVELCSVCSFLLVEVVWLCSTIIEMAIYGDFKRFCIMVGTGTLLMG